MDLGVPSAAPRTALLGECSMLPVKVKCTLKMVKCWLKLINLDNTNLVKSAYNMLFQLDIAGRETWVGKIKSVLVNIGLEEAWLKQRVNNEKLFLNIVEERMIIISQVEWSNNGNNNGRLDGSKYLTCVKNPWSRKCLALLRCSCMSPVKYRKGTT